MPSSSKRKNIDQVYPEALVYWLRMIGITNIDLYIL